MSGKHRAGGVGLLERPVAQPITQPQRRPSSSRVPRSHAARRRSFRPRYLLGVLPALAAAIAVPVVMSSSGGDAKPATAPAPVAVPAVRADIGPLTRVEVLLDAPIADGAVAAQRSLARAGLDVVKVLPDVPYGQYSGSRVLVFDSSERSRALATRAAASLGIPTASIFVTNQSTVVTDAIVILGADLAAKAPSTP